MSDSPPRIPGYVVGSALGRGGMGTVYRAVELATSREVALKWLPATAREALRARFAREARAAAALKHPHIVPIYTAGSTPDGDYIVMELVRGRALDEATKERDQLAIIRCIAKVG